MRSLFPSDKSRETPERAAGRSDALRLTTMAANSRIVIIVAILLMPFALYFAIHGLFLPVVIAGLGLASGFATTAFQQRGRYDAADAAQIYAIFAVGAVLAVSNPAFADFGLAISLMGPIQAGLLGDGRLKRRAWLLVAVVMGIALASAVGLPLWPEVYQPVFGLVGGLAFAVIALVVAHTANRLDTVFEVYERAQINAYRHLLEHVQDAVMRFSVDGELVFTSHTSEKLLGCRRYELVGGGLVERIHVLDRPVFLTALADANHRAIARSVEIRIRRDSVGAQTQAPQFVWIELALSPVLEGKGGDTRHEVVALLRDITGRRDQENEMRAARTTAEAASEAKSRFLATIGHELRTPLNAIVGFSEMMTDDIGGKLSPTHREYAELIHKSGSHLIEVVGMLLDMSRIEAGKFELSTDTFSPATLLDPCLHMVEALAREKHISFVSRVAPSLPPIVADERACRQILINLLSNAVKFSHEHGTVTVTMKRQGTFVNLSVADSGIGMSPEALARIGEPFFQAQDGLARRYEGTGLGLSIVKGLVDLHQGSLRVVSEAGNGTTMTVLLPINGPETKISETSSVTPLRREATSQPEAQWPEQKRSAK
ncbi:MAG: ATP-binding protein [Devosia sp.]